MAGAVVSIPVMPELFAVPTLKQAPMQKNLPSKPAAEVGCLALPHIRSCTQNGMCYTTSTMLTRLRHRTLPNDTE